MPNHLHGVIVLLADVQGAIHESAVRAIHESPVQPIRESSAPMPVTDRRRMLLSKVIGRFKMVSAKRINDLLQSRGSALWQRNYYEHIVRDDESLNRIRQYIIDNPAQWEFDRENPAVGTSER